MLSQLTVLCKRKPFVESLFQRGEFGGPFAEQRRYKKYKGSNSNGTRGRFMKFVRTLKRLWDGGKGRDV